METNLVIKKATNILTLFILFLYQCTKKYDINKNKINNYLYDKCFVRFLRILHLFQCNLLVQIPYSSLNILLFLS